MKKNIDAFVTRHSLKPDEDTPESERYPGISEAGVELAKKRAAEIKEYIEELPKDAVVFIGGASNIPRTASTAEVYGDELKDILDKEEYEVITTEEVKKVMKQAGSMTRGIDALAKKVKEAKDKRVVITAPIFINELSFGRRWGLIDENYDYIDYIEEKCGRDDEAMFAEWVRTQGRVEEKGIVGPDPNKVAEEYIAGIDRLKKFAQKHIGDRPIVIGAVSHRLDLDAAAVKLVAGEVNEETVEQVLKGQLTAETEPLYIRVDGDEVSVDFREEK